MEFTETELPGVFVVDPLVHEDARGFLMETWSAAKYATAGIDAAFVLHVHSRSSLGVIRGLHYQLNKPQGKLIRVIRGEIFDVAVDLRRSSPGFGRWVGETLSEGNRRQLWIPPGFAHGFMVTSEFADIEYRMTDYYAPEHERTVLWNDSDIAIDWPSDDGVKPVISDKDLRGAALNKADVYE